MLFVRDTHEFARDEARARIVAAPIGGDISTRDVFVLTTLKEPALSSVSQAGLVNNLNDGLAWGLFPLLFAAHDLSTAAIGVLAALYPAVWGLGQLVTGPLSDRMGRKRLIVGGMWVQAVALGVIAATTTSFSWALGAIALGVGTAMVYPTFLAAIGDVAHPTWRASAVGVYRLWRDAGFAIGALVAGVLADLFSIETAIWGVAVITALSGLVVAVRMYETHPTPER
jgi:MFS family permease